MLDVSKAETSILQIDFNATMISPAKNSSIKDQNFWVSAGAEYNNQNDIWIGQSMYIAKENNQVKYSKSSWDFILFHHHHQVALLARIFLTLSLSLSLSLSLHISLSSIAPGRFSKLRSVSTHRADVNKFLMVGQHWHVYVSGYREKNH